MANSPTLRRRKLAAEMRRLREAAGMTIDDAARRAEVSKSTLSRVENALVTPRLPALRAMLTVYGVEEEATDLLVQLAREANQRGWWHQYSDITPEWFEVYVGLEDAAKELRIYEPLFVHGLLQTEAYAHAVIRSEHVAQPAPVIERRVAMRMDRQSRIPPDNRPQLWVVLDQAVLHRQVGGHKVMRDQLDHLLDVSEMPRTTLLVLPWAAGSYPSMGSAFTIMSFLSDPDVVFLENRVSALYLEDSERVASFTLTFDHLRATAESADKTRDLIRVVKAEL
jgi:transcriptional regulator with XRE-family HTH domain